MAFAVVDIRENKSHIGVFCTIVSVVRPCVALLIFSWQKRKINILEYLGLENVMLVGKEGGRVKGKKKKMKRREK